MINSQVRDAIMIVLESGPKTGKEICEITGFAKNSLVKPTKEMQEDGVIKITKKVINGRMNYVYEIPNDDDGDYDVKEELTERGTRLIKFGKNYNPRKNIS